MSTIRTLVTVADTGEILRVAHPFSFSQARDEMLDTLQFQIPFSTRKAPYEQWTPLFVTVSTLGEEEPNIKQYVYLIDRDTPTRVSAKPLLYKHTISAIEPTAYLDKLLSPTCSFLQPLDPFLTTYDLEDVLNRLLAIHEPLLATDILTIQLTNTLQNDPRFANKRAPEFVLERRTLREAINEALKSVSALCRASFTGTTFFIGADFLNDRNRPLPPIPEISSSSEVEVINYATNFVSNITNGVSNSEAVHAPMINEVLSTRPPQGTVIYDQTTAIFETSLPIYEIRSMQMCVFEIVPGTPDFYHQIYTTVKNRIVEKQEFDTLPFDLGGGLFVEPRYDDPPDQSNTFYYTSGSNVIQNVGVLYDIVFKRGVWETISRGIYQLFRDADPEKEYSYPGQRSNVHIYWIKLQYVPIIHSNVTVARTVLGASNVYSMVPTHQSETIIDVGKSSLAMRGKIDRSGLETRYQSFRIANTVNMPELGDYTEDGFIVTNVNTMVYKDYLHVFLTLSENFNRLSDFIGVDQRRREFEIPDTLNAVVRPVTVNEYLVLGFEGPTESKQNTFLKPIAIVTLLRSFNQGLARSPAMGAGRITFLPPNDPNLSFVRGAATLALYATFSIIFKMEGNFSAGRGLIVGEDQIGFRAIGNKYAEADGRLTAARFAIIDGKEVEPPPIPQQTDVPIVVVADSRLLPKSDTDNHFTTFGEIELAVDKDRGETLSFTYNLHIIPAVTLEKTIIVGNFFTNFNDLITDFINDNKDFYVWYSDSEIYHLSDVNFAKGVRLSSPTLRGVAIPGETFGFIEIIGTPLPPDAKSFAIATLNGELILGINDVTQDRIYVSLHRNRPGETYLTFTKIE